jgi:hypothetical protein
MTSAGNPEPYSPPHGRFTPNSGSVGTGLAPPLRARTRLMHRTKSRAAHLFDHLVGS